MAKSKVEHRRKIYVDPEVQLAVLRFGSIYWLFTMLTYALVVCIYRIVPHAINKNPLDAGTLWHYFAPMLLASVVLLPIVLHRAIRFSHRLVGPMVRFRRVVKQLASGSTPEAIKLRDKDFWTDFAEELNKVSARFQELSDNAKAAEEEQDLEQEVAGSV